MTNRKIKSTVLGLTALALSACVPFQVGKYYENIERKNEFELILDEVDTGLARNIKSTKNSYTTEDGFSLKVIDLSFDYSNGSVVISDGLLGKLDGIADYVEVRKGFFKKFTCEGDAPCADLIGNISFDYDKSRAKQLMLVRN